MGVALTVPRTGPVQSEVAYLPVGMNQIQRYWLPIIESETLELLDVAVTGGLTVTPEYHPQLVREVEVLLSKLKESLVSAPVHGDVLRRVGKLLELLKMHTPSMSCEVYVG